MTSAWQDIETAPKDGTAILIYEPPRPLRGTMGGVHFDYPRYAIGYWRVFARSDGRPYGGWGNRNAADVKPTHWMPLPAPPVQHASDCAVHNAPALPVGPCDCGAEPPA